MEELERIQKAIKDASLEGIGGLEEGFEIFDWCLESCASGCEESCKSGCSNGGQTGTTT